MKTYTQKETAAEMRKVLREKFSGTKFRVYCHHSSIRVEWVDGPSYTAVEKEAQFFAGAVFVQNGGDDIKGYAAPSLYKGEEVRFQCDFIFCERILTPALQIHLDSYIKNYYSPSTPREALRHYTYEIEQGMSGEEIWGLKA